MRIGRYGAKPQESPAGRSRPRVSVGMPLYNGERYLREALDSLLKQSFQDFEVILSDNASTDSTERICREFAAGKPNTLFFRQEKNIGAVANFNFVLEKAVGTYFIW